MTITTAAAHILNLVARGIDTEKTIAAELAATDGRSIIASDVRAPGRQLDELERKGLIIFVGDAATMTEKSKTTRIAVA